MDISPVVHRFPDIPALLSHVTAGGSVRHFSMGMWHSTLGSTCSARLFAEEIVPILARDHHVRHVIAEHLPEDHPHALWRAVVEGRYRIDRLAINGLTRDRAFHQRVIGPLSAGRLRLDQLSLEEMMGAIITLNGDLIYFYEMVQRLAANQGIRVNLYGVGGTFHARCEAVRTEAFGSMPLLHTLGFMPPSAAQTPVSLAMLAGQITAGLRITSRRLLGAGKAVATLTGAAHNTDATRTPPRLFGTTVDAKQWTQLTSPLLTTIGREVFAGIYCLFPEVWDVVEEEGHVVRQYVKRVIRTMGHSTQLTMRNAAEDPWTVVVMPPRYYPDLLKTARDRIVGA